MKSTHELLFELRAFADVYECELRQRGCAFAIARDGVLISRYLPPEQLVIWVDGYCRGLAHGGKISDSSSSDLE
jgi:hypothetical protein